MNFRCLWACACCLIFLISCRNHGLKTGSDSLSSSDANQKKMKCNELFSVRFSEVASTQIARLAKDKDYQRAVTLVKDQIIPSRFLGYEFRYMRQTSDQCLYEINNGEYSAVASIQRSSPTADQGGVKKQSGEATVVVTLLFDNENSNLILRFPLSWEKVESEKVTKLSGRENLKLFTRIKSENDLVEVGNYKSLEFDPCPDCMHR